MIGNTISHYRIVSQLGVGGMGVVYEAVDPRLGRPVALKFVPEEMSHDLHALERLRSEARTASGLNHPNICTIYDVGEHEGRPFIVMELLKGQTLRDKIALSPLKIYDALDIGIQVADALDCAHQRKVIHRDIKPANLFMVDRGHVKILDFGLAKLLSRELGTQMTLAPTMDHTAAGVALGTVAYMSPEQVQGEALDGRTDLFSLGVVLYECVTGHQPFKGKTSAVVFASILTQAPTAPVTLNPDLPARLQDVINNCLEKDRDLRYQEAASLRADLKRVKRDLESGAASIATTTTVFQSSGAVATVGGAITGAVAKGPPPGASSGVSISGIASVEPARSRSGWSAGWVAGSAAAVVGIAAVLGVFLLRGNETPPPATLGTLVATTVSSDAPPPASGASPLDRAMEQATSNLQAGNYRSALSFAEQALLLAPDHASARRLRDDAQAALARFDGAVADANRALTNGDLDAATRGVNVARALDPASPVVADLSSRLVDSFRTQTDAARRATAEPSRTDRNEAARAQAPRRTAAGTVVPVTPPATAGGPAVATVAAASEMPGPAASASAPIVAARPADTPAPGVEPLAERRPPPVASPAAPPVAAPAAAPVNDDDTEISRVVAAYARAIESKDVALFRSVKPNLTREEQRRIEEGFRAVTSQRVAITIESIERRGQEAVVRLRRHDVIQAGGRQQTADSQQTMTLARAGAAWVIREIGR